MLHAPVAAEKVLVYKNMARIIIHQHKTKEEVEAARLRENFALSHEERIKKNV